MKKLERAQLALTALKEKFRNYHVIVTWISHMTTLVDKGPVFIIFGSKVPLENSGFPLSGQRWKGY